MAPTQAAAQCGPPVLVKWGVSLLFLVHLAAILSAVTSASSAKFPAPYLAVKANEPFRPYLQTLFQTNAYRFFAPDPGSTPLLWFRLQYQDGSARWVEVPSRQDAPLPMAYQRFLSVPALGVHIVSDARQADQSILSAMSEVCVASYVRFVSKNYANTSPGEGAGLVQEVKVYHLSHMYLIPEQLRMGWQPTDLRLYHPTYLGAYTTEGTRTDGKAVLTDYMSNFVAYILAEDVQPLTAGANNENGTSGFEKLHLPQPIHQLVMRFPELLQPADANLVQRIIAAVESQDNAAIKAKLMPEIDYPTKW